MALGVVLIGGWARGQQAGVPPEWDAQKIVEALRAEVAEIRALVGRLEPEQWVKQGAAESYVGQVKRLVEELEYLERNAKELAASPGSIRKALEVYLRAESVDAMLNSANEAARRYQNPAFAELVSSSQDKLAAARSRLRDYLVELVGAKEEECRIAHEEAQRCRLELIQRPSKD